MFPTAFIVFVCVARRTKYCTRDRQRVRILVQNQIHQNSLLRSQSHIPTHCAVHIYKRKHTHTANVRAFSAAFTICNFARDRVFRRGLGRAMLYNALNANKGAIAALQRRHMTFFFRNRRICLIAGACRRLADDGGLWFETLTPGTRHVFILESERYQSCALP